MKNEERIIEVLQSQITSGRFKSLNELSTFLGLTETTKSKLYNVLNKDMSAGYKTICEWFDKLEIPLLSLGQSNEDTTYDKSDIPTITRIGENAPIDYVEGTNLHKIPVYGFTGAGGEVELIENEPIAIISILPQYNFANMYSLKVDGDSMHPTIPKGSYVGVTPYNGTMQEGGVYVVERPYLGRMIKRIKMNEEGGLSLFSDNPSYVPIPLDKVMGDSEIVGRVMWILSMP